MSNAFINSNEKRYKKTTNANKDVVLTLRTLEDGTTKEVHFLNFRENPDKPSKRRDRFFVKQLAKDKELDRILLPNDLERAKTEGVLPAPYVVDYKIPLDLGGSGNTSNMYVVDRDVAKLMEHLYWKQIRTEIRALRMRPIQQRKQSRIGVSFAPIPHVFTEQAFLQYIQQHERKELQKYLAKKKQADTPTPQKVIFQNLPNGELLLQPIASGPVPKGFEMAIVRVFPREWNDRTRLRGEYTQLRTQIALDSLKRGDFDAWPEGMRKKIASSGGHVPSVAQVTCHHILPLLLGGDNKMKNICWLNEHVHNLIHSKFIAPLESCLFSLSENISHLFFEMPIPEGTALQTYKLDKGELVPNPMPEATQLRKTLQILSSSPTTQVRKHKRLKKKKPKKPRKNPGQLVLD